MEGIEIVLIYFYQVDKAEKEKTYRIEKVRIMAIGYNYKNNVQSLKSISS